MLKLNHKFDHLVEVLNSACKAPFDFSLQWIIIIVCCVLGLLWAAYNIWLVLKIDVKKGITGDQEDDARRNDISQHQKDLLIELGEKISEVILIFILGSPRIFESRVSHLPYLRFHHVPHHRLLHRIRYQNWYCLHRRSSHINRLWCRRHGYCNSSQL